MSEENIKRVEARIIVDYDTSHIGPDEIMQLPYGLSRTIVHQIGAGLLTGHTSALVETYEVSVNVPPMWYVRAEDEDGNNFDLILRASDRDRALALWKAYYSLNDETAPQVDYVGKVPETAVEGAISWSDINDPLKKET